MAYDAILTALADPTRRAILDRMRTGPLPVGRIADGLPVSRPAVSQHLKVMLAAGMVTRTSKGTRNIYALAPGGAAPLVRWLGALRPEPKDAGLSVFLRLTPQEAWALFTDGLATWWPVARLSVSASQSGALPMMVALDADALRETTFDGQVHVWAAVTERVEGQRIAFDWKLDSEGPVTVSFEEEAGGCRVAVDAPADAGAFWELALVERFGAAARASLSNF